MALGIDLGTCNTVAASTGRDGVPVLIPDCNLRENLTTPSILHLDNRSALVGVNAENYMELYPEKNFIRYYKRNFGTQNPVLFDEKGNAWFSEAIAALMLKKIKFDAEMFLHDLGGGLVITVPAHYNDAQRKSVIEAAKLADLSLDAIVEEPVAAAINYISKISRGEEIVMVYDFGGGTFDLTIMTRSGNEMYVLAKDGISNLGGKEFDEVIAQKIMEDYGQCFGENLPMDMANANKIRKLSEAIKLSIFSEKNAQTGRWITFGKRAFEFNMDHQEFADKSAGLILMTEKVVERCLRSVGLSFSDIAKMILVGGTSKIPFIKEYWAKKINPAKQELIFHDPMNSVALGASVYAAGFAGNSNGKMELKTVATYNLALKGVAPTEEQVEVLIQKNTPLPFAATKTVKLNPRAKVSYELLQFWDINQDKTVLGNIHIGPFESASPIHITISLENRANGTIGLKVKNAENGKDMRFDFVKTKSEYTYNFEEQKKLVDNILINNIV